MDHKCTCSSDRFIRRWSAVSVLTPCTIDIENRMIRMDFSREEQWDSDLSQFEFYCASCGAAVPEQLQREISTEYDCE